MAKIRARFLKAFGAWRVATDRLTVLTQNAGHVVNTKCAEKRTTMSLPPQETALSCRPAILE